MARKRVTPASGCRNPSLPGVGTSRFRVSEPLASGCRNLSLPGVGTSRFRVSETGGSGEGKCVIRF
ncbi:hypothetical protein [Parabacteroides distasonis]|uniref:hypothetical protein n=1 Tax=Parabacteroides distasonis TaxID=823 RepID=UPI0011C3B98D|nr:hypothetical protein [Parabacteroides distasonis]